MSKLCNRFLGLVFAGACVAALQATAYGAAPARFDISQHGAVADGKTVNTKAIQAAIDQCAAAGGGTLVIPKGEFVTGSVFLKPGVNVELLEGAVLKGSTNIEDFPIMNSRFE